MKAKTFLILVGATLVLAAVAYLVYQSGSEPAGHVAMGRKLFEQLPANEITAITIAAADTSVHLQKGAQVWEVADRKNYPADFAKISELVKKIRDLKIGRSFPADAETVQRLGLNSSQAPGAPGDGQGIRIVLAEKDGRILADLLLSRTDASQSVTGGHFLMKADRKTIYLVDRNFNYLEPSPAAWIEKSLVNVPAQEVEKVVAYDPKQTAAVYTLKRPQKDKPPEWISPPETGEPDPEKIRRVFEALSSLTVDDVTAATASHDRKASSARLEFHLYDGTVYRAYPGETADAEKDTFYFRLEKAPPTTEPEPKPGEHAAAADTGPASSYTPAGITPGSWRYVISKWKYDDFMMDARKLFKDKAKESE